MVYQPVENTVQVAMNYRLLGQKMQNTLYFHVFSESIPYVFFNEINLYVHGLWNDTIRPFQTNACTLDNITVTDLTFQDSLSLKFQHNSPCQQIALPVNTGTTFTTTFRTAGRGRSFRGRNYFIGLGETMIEGNTIDDDVLNATLNFYNSIMDGMGGLETPSEWVVVQRQFEGEILPAGVTHQIISVDHVDVYADYQRRRGEGRGQ